MNSSLISMVEKAKRYAEEPERISITGLEVDFRGINGSHRVGLRGDEWSCECEHFHDHGLCIGRRQRRDDGGRSVRRRGDHDVLRAVLHGEGARFRDKIFCIKTTSMAALLPTPFLFRYSVPVHYRGKLPARGERLP